MNNFALTGALLVVALAIPLCATAQAPAPAPAPKQAPPAAAPAPKAAAAPVAPAPVAAAPAPAAEKPMKRVSHRVPSKADARACLEFPTNLQVIKCAEKYRYAT